MLTTTWKEYPHQKHVLWQYFNIFLKKFLQQLIVMKSKIHDMHKPKVLKIILGHSLSHDYTSCTKIFRNEK